MTHLDHDGDGAADVDDDGRDELLTLRVSAFDFHQFDITGDLEAVGPRWCGVLETAGPLAAPVREHGR